MVTEKQILEVIVLIVSSFMKKLTTEVGGSLDNRTSDLNELYPMKVILFD